MALVSLQRHSRNYMTTLLLPSAGSAIRFRGIIKELLPISPDGMTVLEQTIETGLRYFPIDRIRVVTNPHKEHYHRRVLQGYEIEFVTQERNELWGAIQDGLVDDDIVMLLPDTKVIVPAPIIRTYDFMLGTFATKEPWRFSVLEGDKIHTKKNAGIYAWGALYWSRAVSNFLMQTYALHYDDAFNEVLQYYSYTTFPITYYEDFGDVEHYLAYIRSLPEGLFDKP